MPSEPTTCSGNRLPGATRTRSAETLAPTTGLPLRASEHDMQQSCQILCDTATYLNGSIESILLRFTHLVSTQKRIR